MSATDADRLKSALAWEKAMRAPATTTVNPPALVGGHDAGAQYHNAIDPNRVGDVRDPMGTRAAAASWRHGVEASTAADAKQLVELNRQEAQRRQEPRDLMQGDGS